MYEARMGLRRPIISVALFAVALVCFFLYHRTQSAPPWRTTSKPETPSLSAIIAKKVNMGELDWAYDERPGELPDNSTLEYIKTLDVDWKDKLVPGTPIPGHNYSRVLVIPRIKKENVDWFDKELPEFEKVVYVADDPTAPLHPPANKGHEAIVYLTYIIDHYDDLPDIMLFMHAHRRTWHNNDALGSDSAEIIRRLNPHRVIREGYMNLRCQWYPGCPDWMHPGNTEFDIHKTEQILIARAWVELFPFDPVPDVLAQPCCSQFALSKQRVRSIPKAHFEYYRNWLMNTKLKDFISGRVWEYMWQYAFTGQNFWCPVEHLCYCDAYGVCFGGKEQYDEWVDIKKQRDVYNMKLLRWQRAKKAIDDLTQQGRLQEAAAIQQPEEGKDREWWDYIQGYQRQMDKRANVAIERGKNTTLRTQEMGWDENDVEGLGIPMNSG